MAKSKKVTTYIKKINDDGSITTISTGKSSNSRDNFNLFITLFRISLVLIFGGYFFSNGVQGFNNSEMLSTANTEYITNVINDYEYNYRVHSSNYDYTNKLTQLYTLRNVFDLNANTIDASLLVEPTDSLFQVGGQYHYYYDVYYELCIDDSDIGEEIMYIDTATINIDGTDYTYTLFRLNQLQDEVQVSQFYSQYAYFLDNFVNWKNAPLYQDYLKGEGQYGYFSGIVTAFKYLNAPIIWVGNLAYNIGVIINFLINW